MNRKARNIFYRMLIILCAVAPAIALGDSPVKIGIIKSSENSYYNKTIETILDNAGSAWQIKIADINPDTNHITGIEDTDLIIALGASATALAAQYQDKKLITAYLTRQQLDNYDLDNSNHSAVLLDQPLLRYLAFSHFLLNTRAIGLIGLDNIDLSAREKRFLLKQGTKLEQKQISQFDELLPVLRQLVKQTSCLLMLPDLRIYNRTSLKGVLLTTYRSRTPVISYSPAHVKSGALASIYSSPENIGAHLVDLLNEFVSSGSLPPEDHHFARYYSIAINHQVARALNLSLPDEEQLRMRLEEVLQ